MGAAIEVDQVTKQYGDVWALRGVSFTVSSGECFGLLGPNGAGKSTLIRILSTLEPATSGTVICDGLDLRRNQAAIRRRMGVALQATGIDPLMTGRETLQLMGRLYGLPHDILQQRIREIITRFHLESVCDRPIRTYSGGMRRRLDLATALVHDPAVIVLDEPTTGLDPTNRQALWSTLTSLSRDDGKTVLLTTQYLEEADALCDRVLFIDQGMMVAHGSPDDLKREMGYSIIRAGIKGADPSAVNRALREAGIDAVWERERLALRSSSPAHDLHDLEAALASVDAHLDHLEVQPPSLDDVFNHLTRSSQEAH